MRQPAPESGPDRRWGGHAAIPWELLIAPNECALATGPRGSVLPLSLSSREGYIFSRQADSSTRSGAGEAPREI